MEIILVPRYCRTCTPIKSYNQIARRVVAHCTLHQKKRVMLIAFWVTVCKTVRPVLSDRCLSVCLSCLSCPVCPVCHVCDVDVLWPNGWTDQDETWHAGRPGTWPHSVGWEPSDPPPKGHSPSIFGLYLHIRCGPMAGWINMPLGMEVGLAQAILC